MFGTIKVKEEKPDIEQFEEESNIYHDVEHPQVSCDEKSMSVNEKIFEKTENAPNTFVVKNPKIPIYQKKIKLKLRLVTKKRELGQETDVIEGSLNENQKILFSYSQEHDKQNDGIISETLIEAERISKLNRKHLCHICHYSTDKKSSLTSHMITHTGVRRIVCPICGKKLRGDLKRHMRIHTGEKPHQCVICGQQFIAKSTLDSHVSHIHEGEPRKEGPRVVCNICGKLVFESGLRDHQLSHSGERPHKCDMCGKSFIRAKHLKCHRLIHTETKSHYCTLCGKSFITKDYLRQHMVVHDSEKKSHKCEHCGSAYSHLQDLRKHMLVHFGKSNECQICRKTFTLAKGLKQHMAVHSGNKQHKCPFCGKCFNRAGNMRSHIAIHDKIGNIKPQLIADDKTL